MARLQWPMPEHMPAQVCALLTLVALGLRAYGMGSIAALGNDRDTVERLLARAGVRPVPCFSPATCLTAAQKYCSDPTVMHAQDGGESDEVHGLTLHVWLTGQGMMLYILCSCLNTD